MREAAANMRRGMRSLGAAGSAIARSVACGRLLLPLLLLLLLLLPLPLLLLLPLLLFLPLRLLLLLFLGAA